MTDPTERFRSTRDAIRASAAQLTDLQRRMNPATGLIEPDPEPESSESPESPEAPETPGREPGSFDGGVRQDQSRPSLQDRIAAAEEAGDMTLALQLKAVPFSQAVTGQH
jgi:hypothetical protein